MDEDILALRLGLPSLANKNTQFPIQFEFQITNEYSWYKYGPKTCTKILFIIHLKFKF